MSLFYANPLGGRVGFFAIPLESVDAVTWLNCFEFSWILLPTFCTFSPANVGAFLNVVFFFNMI